ncbi:hypothetical protein DFH09DRAFT_1090301 [Mycena vulgaris]|nr:hypothetical protein DFH09DRAFT_1090301 [Mycena vulgaris]
MGMNTVCPLLHIFACVILNPCKSLRVIDVIRISDGAFVSLKPIDSTIHPDETSIGLWFSEEPQAPDPSNHCVPIGGVLDVPGAPTKRIIIMPFLSSYDNLVSIQLEGLLSFSNRYLRDCMAANIMVDATPLFPAPYHTIPTDQKRDWSGRGSHLTCTQRPVKCYLIDFGLSRKYPAGVHAPLEPIIVGGDKTVPELFPKEDPLPLRFYGGGRFVRKKLGFEFSRSLMTDMVQDDPSLRPTMDNVVHRFDEIVITRVQEWMEETAGIPLIILALQQGSYQHIAPSDIRSASRTCGAYMKKMWRKS